jgi:hypothetical protein
MLKEMIKDQKHWSNLGFFNLNTFVIIGHTPKILKLDWQFGNCDGNV